MKNVVIVGGGTAGWLTALFVKSNFQEANVTLIASEEVGILGAGEGTVNYFSAFLQNLKIDPYKVIEECSGTIKTSVKFVDWIPNKTFYHPFNYNQPKEHLSFEMYLEEIKMLDEILNLPKEIESYDVGDLLSISDRVPIIKDKKHTNAFHFDAVKLANYLKSVAIQRGINYFDDFVQNIETDEQGYFRKINCSKNTFDCDFIFDCTGFKRLILGKMPEAEWVDVSKRLPVDKAIPFFLPADKTLESYTTATAMDFGWTWKIPLQHRSGCGYVYSSDFCSDEQAVREIHSKYGNVDIVRSFSFKSGYYKNPWLRNCMALGLSGGFLEPLEATSIWTTMVTLSKFLYEIDVMFDRTRKAESARKSINSAVSGIYDSTVDFLQLHYFTKRNNTKFWEYMNNDSPRSAKLNEFLEKLNYRPIYENESLEHSYFNAYSWLRFANLFNMIDKEQHAKRLTRMISGKETQFLKERKRLINILKFELPKYKTQNKFIEGYLSSRKMYK